jgi:cellulose synthase/poly-beta-1,6-N-acetylglucosamine synthase-like glycosyltransferase
MSTLPDVSAYVPCFNDRTTLGRTLDSLAAQTVPVSEVVVIDDGSDDGSVDSVHGHRVRVVRHRENLGRGAARARAMEEVASEYVVCCDANKALDPAFVARALKWFDDPTVAAVFGPIRQPLASSPAERWRGRHLFKEHVDHRVCRSASLSTAGALVRAGAVRCVGGYDARLTHSEDADLGSRLLAAGYDVVFDPALVITATAPNSWREVLERYWRWHAGPAEAVTLRGYAQGIAYAVKSMMAADLRERDALGALVSFMVPHYQFGRSLWRSRRLVHRAD